MYKCIAGFIYDDVLNDVLNDVFTQSCKFRLEFPTLRMKRNPISIYSSVWFILTYVRFDRFGTNIRLGRSLPLTYLKLVFPPSQK